MGDDESVVRVLYIDVNAVLNEMSIWPADKA